MKRAFDFVTAAVALVALMPVFAVIALAIRLDTPGPILFMQDRIGARGSRFRMYKFRTMRDDAPHDVPTHLMDGAGRHVTNVGRLLRKSSLDELPQLFNIVKGDMSFVGPRPALWNQDDLIALRAVHGANDVRPGLTGWAQIHGRDELEIEKKAALDGYYVQHQSLWLDLKCVLGTILPVVHGIGVVEGRSSSADKTADSATETCDVDPTTKVGCGS